VQVVPGDAGRGVPLGGEDAIAFAVLLERLPGAVGLSAVELDRDPQLLPEAVDLKEASAQGDMGAFIRGRGRPRASTKARKASSKSFRVIPTGSVFRSANRASTNEPLRPG
jgi:hypothetical protein